MSRRYFGTDGVRGRVGEPPITADFALRLGYAAGRVLARAGEGAGERPAVVIGKDTRISGYMLESAMESGLSAAGVDVLLLGPMPTPAVAYLTRALRARAGVMISASHNPFEDNGIKFFSAAGTKLPDAVELAIEAELDQPMQTMPSAQLGKARRIDDAAGRYIEFCKSTYPTESDLRGQKIVVDCAHGATYHIAPAVLHELGADVTSIGVQPDGLNINRLCGSTYPETLRAEVLARGGRPRDRARWRWRPGCDGGSSGAFAGWRPAALHHCRTSAAAGASAGWRRRNADDQPGARTCVCDHGDTLRSGKGG